MSINILYIEHEINNLNSFRAAFRRDAEVFLSETTVDGFKVLQENKIDIVFADHQMPETTGIAFFEQVSEQFPETVRVLLTCHAYKEEFRNALKAGHIHYYVNKPWDEEELRFLINTCVATRSLKVELK